MTEYYSNVLREAKQCLQNGCVQAAVTTIRGMDIRPFTEEEAAEVIAGFYIHLLDSFVAKVGIEVEDQGRLWSVIKEDEHIEAKTTYNHNSDAVDMLSRFRYYKENDKEGALRAICREMSEDGMRDKFSSLFTMLALLPRVETPVRVSLDDLDREFNTMCQNATSVSMDAVVEFATKLLPWAHAGTFNLFEEISDLRKLTKGELYTYIEHSLCAFAKDDETLVRDGGVAGNLCSYASYSGEYPADVKEGIFMSPDAGPNGTAPEVPDSSGTVPEEFDRSYSEGQPEELAKYNLEIPKRFSFFRIKRGNTENNVGWGWLKDSGYNAVWQNGGMESDDESSQLSACPRIVSIQVPHFNGRGVSVFEPGVLAIPFEGCFEHTQLDPQPRNYTAQDDITAMTEAVSTLSLEHRVLFELHTARAMHPMFITCECDEWNYQGDLEQVPAFMETAVRHEGPYHVCSMMYTGVDVHTGHMISVDEYIETVKFTALEICSVHPGAKVKVYNGLNGECLYINGVE